MLACAAPGDVYAKHTVAAGAEADAGADAACAAGAGAASESAGAAGTGTGVCAWAAKKARFDTLLGGDDKLAVKVFRSFCRTLSDRLRRTTGRVARRRLLRAPELGAVRLQRVARPLRGPGHAVAEEQAPAEGLVSHGCVVWGSGRTASRSAP